MKIKDLLSEQKLLLSFEVFPPKSETAFDSVREATEKIARLAPSFMSVTYGAGGGTSKYTLDIARNIKERYGVPTLAHLTCFGSTRQSVREKIEQLNLFEAEDDTDDIHREIAAIIGGDALFTDYTDTISEDTLDTGYTLILPTDTDPVPAEEMPRQADANEDAPAATEEDAGEVAEEDGDTEEDDALLLQNLRRAFSVEFETFDSKKSAKKPSEEEEFSFVENEAPKKRGFLSRLIGGDSDN